MIKHAFGLLAGLGFISAALGADGDSPDLWTRMTRYHVDYRLNADGSNVRTYDYAYTVLNEKGIDDAKTSRISYSTSVESATVVKAYTLKKGGKKITVPKSNYQLNVNSGHGGGGPAFSDRTTLTVIFPELGVGDTAVLVYKITQKEPIFPGHFSVREVFSRYYAYDDVRVTIDAPKSMKVRYESQELAQKESEKGARRIVEWTWKNPTPGRNKRRNYSVWDIEKEPGLVYSTFDSYRQIVDAYAARARAKAVPDERVKKLAEEIVGARKDPREQARALYDWVATKIGYAGNCIGVGTVVPRDLAFVLDNKMGDCKDHATLLQALLSARGIAVTQALINAGSLYQLPKIPDVASVNHVINYLPAMDLFLDSTSDSTPFGMLPLVDQDKPVLIVDGYQEGRRTPPTPVGDNRQELTQVMDVAPDGSIAASIKVSQHGLYAAGTREWMRRLPKDREGDLVNDYLKQSGITGSGSLEKDDPSDLLDTYAYGIKLQVKDFIQRPGSGAFYVAPVWGTSAPVQHYVANAFLADDDYPTACTSGSSVEDYVYRLPKDMKVLSVPDDMKVSNDFLSYEATYRLKGAELTVHRVFDDRTRGGTCPPEMSVAYKEFAKKVAVNLKAQVLYK